MFQIGDVVAYGAHGVCRITGMEHKEVGGKSVSYFVLEPLGVSGTSFFVPMHHPVALAKIRPVITKQELFDAVISCGDDNTHWISDESKRKQHYRELVASGDWKNVLYTVISIHNKKTSLSATGKKLHLCDENFLRDAQKMLNLELSLVLNIPECQVPEFMKHVLQEQ